MHIRWKRRTLVSNRQTGEPVCDHTWVNRPKTLTPVLVRYENGKYVTMWRPGPSIRECCIDGDNGMAFAAWWYEVDQRFEDLETQGLDNRLLTIELLEQRGVIEALLYDVVPHPTTRERRKYLKFRKAHGNRRRARPPACVTLLGLRWPCTHEEIQASWKKLALEHHPDRGGNTQEFVRFKQAYEKALILVEP